MLEEGRIAFSICFVCPDGGTGRRAGLKIRFSQESGSSTLPLGTRLTDDTCDGSSQTYHNPIYSAKPP